ncbi:hypothetical protein PFISCL1PPCAC_19124 [Pristionchus fissidentatus]|uniref:C-type lectin n=1 Tax=Pristionchus fissidentatus TaxID=1538716 RepID=A0AAV5WA08_9BILA|nr:hypothetical protein PFISCL1PPCAC_19124 [Pristionchus fissidentatus]
MLTVALLASLLYSALATCPNGFDLMYGGECIKQDNKCYDMYAPDGASIARSNCASQRAIPVYIKSQEDNDYWLSVGRTDRAIWRGDPAYGNILLGIECSKSYPYYKWMDGSDIDFVPVGTDPTINNQCEQNGDYCMWYLNPVDGAWVKVCNQYQYVDMYCVIPKSPSPYQIDQYCGQFDINQDEDVCYQVGATPANWTEANSVCRSWGGQVASIHNTQDNSFIRRLAVNKGLINGLMLGAATNSKNVFQWVDGTSWDYQNFASGFPIDGLGGCMAMDTNNINGPWINLDCSTELPFACIRKLQQTPPRCDGTLRTEGDILFSPGFPLISAIPCDFLLEVPPGMLVEVEILFLEANSCCDHLILSEGSLGGGPVIADLTGDTNNGRKFRTKSQNIMRASWQPNGGVNVMGMMITFNAVPM